MPSSLRSRLALVALLGAFLIPIYVSTLRGLTHALTCSASTATPFTLTVDDRGNPTLLSSQTQVRGAPEGLCGGLFLNMRARPGAPGKVALVLPITNRTPFNWYGTVQLSYGPTSVPVNIGAIRAGATVTDTVNVNVQPGTHEVGGSLLIGP